jgi:uncharacterized protein (DUF1697 family)
VRAAAAGEPDVGHGWVALLRAVNLGARNRVPMAELRALLERSGLGDVRTYIQSGNVLFTSPDGERGTLGGRIEDEILGAFGVTTTAILRTFGELRAVASSHPFGSDTSRTHVSFLAAEPHSDAVVRLLAADHGPDRAHVSGSDVFLHYPAGVQGSRLTAAKLERLLGVPGTARNWRTVTALAELAST